MGPFRFARHRIYRKLQRLAASLPETAEVEAWGHPTFRVRNKIFATFGELDEQAVVSVKSTHAKQVLLTAGPGFFVPPYVGKHGWVGIRVDQVGWPVVLDLVEESYRLVAPKALASRLDA